MGHPISLFHEDGFMCQNAKSELVVMLESSTSPLKDITIDPINTVIINVLMRQFIVADIVIELFDRYNIDFSVKACRTGPDAHKIVYRWFSCNSTMEEVLACIRE